MTEANSPLEDNLMRAAAEGDDRAMERLYTRLSPVLFNYLRRLGCSNNDADDVLQSAFLKAWQYRKQFRGHGVRLWMFTITRNTWVSACRSRLRAAQEDEPPVFATPEQDHDAVELSALLEDALLRLPDDTCEVVILSRISGMDAAGIASLLDISEANVRVRLHRGLKSLREALYEK